MTEAPASTSIHNQLRGLESLLADDITGVLDHLSRVLAGIERGNWSYADDKIPGLLNKIEALRIHLNREQLGTTENNRKQPAARAQFVIAAVTDAARHYRAGRALYPINGDPQAAARRATLEQAATDFLFHPPKNLNVADVDRVSTWLRRYAAAPESVISATAP